MFELDREYFSRLAAVGAIGGIIAFTSFYAGEYNARRFEGQTIPEKAITAALDLAQEYHRERFTDTYRSIAVEKLIDSNGATAAVRLFCNGCSSEGVYQNVEEFEESDLNYSLIRIDTLQDNEK